jgi:GT2 family glycosyltransferase
MIAAPGPMPQTAREIMSAMPCPPVFSVIIPVYDKWELTEQCLRSLARHTPAVAYEVIVVDNGSADATAATLPELGESLFGPMFRRIRFEENRNFGPACNAGALAAAAPLVFFLNNDTILTEGWAPPLLNALKNDPRLGGVGPLLLYANNTVQHLGITFTLSGVEHLYRNFPSDHPVVSRTRRYQAITAAALLMPTALFREQGGFFEEYRNGFEDVDLCLRIHKIGKIFTCVPSSVVYHLESQSSGRKAEEGANGKLLFRRCGAYFVADKHLHGLRDGFIPFINDAAGIGLRMKDRDEAALCGKAGGSPPSRWLELIGNNPLWIRGREMLAQLLEENGHPGDALLLRAQIADIRMQADAYAALSEAAKQAGNAEMSAYAESGLAAIRAERLNREYLRGLIRRARAAHDNLLEALLKKAVS